MKGNQTIRTLVLSDIGLGPVGLATLANVMSDMALLTKIDISKNNIGADGAKALLM